MATIDSTGATIKTLNEYLTDIRYAYRAIDAAWNLEPESPDGMATEIWAELFANLDEAVVAAKNAVDPRTAVGEQLDAIGALFLLERQSATFSTATVNLSGTAGTDIPAGTEFRNSETDTLWASDTAVTLDVNGDATVNVTCTTSGPESAGIGDIDEIATPVAGLSSVTNPDAATLGQEEESDVDFRIRRRESVGAPGNNQVESIFAAVANVSGVNRTRIYENFNSTVDSNDLNPHSLAIFAEGGDVSDIGNAIILRKNPGTNLNRANSNIPNEVTETVTTPEGNSADITFFRPELTTIFVEVSITGPYDAAAIKQAIIDYANGKLLGKGTGFDRTGFGVGDNVPVGKLFTPVNNVLGDDAFAESITIGTSSGSLSSATITIPFNGLAVFEESAIDVVTA